MRRDRGLLATALASVGSFLVAPVDPAAPSGWMPEPAPELRVRPLVAVFGLARGCGTTVVARALAAELASRDPAQAATVACESRAAGLPVATQAAARLTRLVEDFPGADARALGRLCLVHGADFAALAEGARQLAPLVLDVGTSSVGGVPAALADRTVLVTPPQAEPALARVAADCLTRVGPEPLIVLNRVTERGSTAARGRAPAEPASISWRGGASADHVSHSNGAVADADGRYPAANHARHAAGQGPIVLPASRLGAQLALSGREPRGELGRAIGRIADRCEG